MRPPIFQLVIAALVAATNVSAQTARDPVAGRLLYEDTPNIAQDGSALTGSCTSGCHGNVQNRRTAIGGGPFAAIEFDTAMARLVNAIGQQPQMRQFNVLTLPEVEHLAAYIADTPKTSASQLDFSPAAVGTPSDAQHIDLSSAVATSETLRVVSVGLSGAGAARFARSSDACDQQVLNPGSTCRVSLTFSAPDAATYDASLTLTLRQGSSTTTFTRAVALRGTMAVVAPPATDSGGGALGLGWLAALGGAVAALARRRRA